MLLFVSQEWHGWSACVIVKYLNILIVVAQVTLERLKGHGRPNDVSYWVSESIIIFVGENERGRENEPSLNIVGYLNSVMLEA